MGFGQQILKEFLIRGPPYVPLLSDVLREVVFVQLLAGSPPQKHLLAVAEYCGVPIVHQYLRCTLDLLACEEIGFEDNDHTTLYPSFPLLLCSNPLLLVETTDVTKLSHKHTKQNNPHPISSQQRWNKKKTKQWM